MSKEKKFFFFFGFLMCKRGIVFSRERLLPALCMWIPLKVGDKEFVQIVLENTYARHLHIMYSALGTIAIDLEAHLIPHS